MLAEINTRNVEILCQMIGKLAPFTVEKVRTDREEAATRKNKDQRPPNPSKTIDLEYIDKVL